MRLSQMHISRILNAAEKIMNVSDEEFLGMFKVMQKEIWGKA